MISRDLTLRRLPRGQQGVDGPRQPEAELVHRAEPFGRRRRITCRLCQIASDNLNGAASQVAMPLPRSPLTLIHSISMCCGGALATGTIIERIS